MRVVAAAVVALLAGCRFNVTALSAANDLAVHDGNGAADLAGLDLAGVDLGSPPPPPPYLRGSKAPLTGNIDLTAVGTIDWAHWGLTSATDFDRRVGGSAIPNYTALGNASPTQTDKFQNGFSWTNGTPHVSADASTTGVYMMGSGNGFGWDIPADTTPRALELYVDSFLATGRLVAHLDDSTVDYSDDSSSPGGATYTTYTLRYRASRATTLHVTWQETSGVGNVGLQAATLAPDPMP